MNLPKPILRLIWQSLMFSVLTAIVLPVFYKTVLLLDSLFTLTWLYNASVVFSFLLLAGFGALGLIKAIKTTKNNTGITRDAVYAFGSAFFLIIMAFVFYVPIFTEAYTSAGTISGAFSQLSAIISNLTFTNANPVIAGFEQTRLLITTILSALFIALPLIMFPIRVSSEIYRALAKHFKTYEFFKPLHT